MANCHEAHDPIVWGGPTGSLDGRVPPSADTRGARVASSIVTVLRAVGLDKNMLAWAGDGTHLFPFVVRNGVILHETSLLRRGQGQRVTVS